MTSSENDDISLTPTTNYTSSFLYLRDINNSALYSGILLKDSKRQTARQQMKCCIRTTESPKLTGRLKNTYRSPNNVTDIILIY